MPDPTTTTQPTWTESEFGQQILRPFKTAPYPHASRADGFKGKTKTFPRDPHYVDSTIGIFIPVGFVPGSEMNLIVHFHGHMNHVSNVLPKYKLPQQLSESKTNAILIVPQGPKDAGDSG